MIDKDLEQLVVYLNLNIENYSKILRDGNYSNLDKITSTLTAYESIRSFVYTLINRQEEIPMTEILEEVNKNGYRIIQEINEN
jgi:hypothetical protein